MPELDRADEGWRRAFTARMTAVNGLLEKATASQDQAGKSGTGDGRGHRRWVEQRRLDEPANVTLGKRWVWTALKHKHLGDLE